MLGADYINNQKNAAEIKAAIVVALKIKLTQLRDELAVAITTGSYQRAGELAYGRIPELEKELKAIETSQPV
jgi:ATP-dependent Clp protease ATP-binding subunit ClpB